MSADDASAKNDTSVEKETPFTDDEQHNDPDAKIVLISSDNVRFRVHAWNLKKKSAFIAEMFDVSNKGDISESPIHLDGPSTIVRTYVDHVYPTKSLLLDMPVSDIRLLLALCERMQSADMEESILASAISCADTEPWDTLVLASDRNNVELAKAAIRALNGENSKLRDFPYPWDSCVTALRPTFLAELFRRRMNWRWMYYNRTDKETRAFVVQDWSVVADNFHPQG